MHLEIPVLFTCIKFALIVPVNYIVPIFSYNTSDTYALYAYYAYALSKNM